MSVTFTGSPLRSIAEATLEVLPNTSFTATGITTGVPVIDSASFSSSPTSLTANNITITPFAENAAISQNHVLSGNNLACTPVISQISISQQHNLIADILLTNAPIVGSPSFLTKQRYIHGHTLVTTRNIPQYEAQGATRILIIR